MNALSYPEVGATTGPLPPGYHHLRRAAQIGRGGEHFERAAAAVLDFAVQRRSGIEVSVRGPIEPGLDLELTLRIGPIRIPAPAQVVWVAREPRRVGFAYGTRVGHPEIGEESFVVEQRDDDTVWTVITAFSRPGTRLARLAGPAGRLLQHLFTERYLRSLKEDR